MTKTLSLPDGTHIPIGEGIKILGETPEEVEIPRPTPRENQPRLCQEVDFEPLGNWCLVKQVESGNTVSGLFIPDDAYAQTFKRGLIMAVGPGTVYSSGAFIENSLKVGDIGLFGRASGMEVMLKEGGFFLFRESECMGKIYTLTPKPIIPVPNVSNKD